MSMSTLSTILSTTNFLRLAFELVTGVDLGVLTKDVSSSKDRPTTESDVTSSDVIAILEKRSKLLRELAITRRIDTAEKVTIEEYYDVKGEGKAGLHAKDKDVSLGISGSGERVEKRIYTFEGWRDGGLQGLDKEIIKALQGEANIDVEIEEQPKE